MTRDLKRYLFFITGIISVAVATLGIVLPLVPTVPLVLLAAFCFSRSSKRFDDWLTNHRVFGSTVRDWRQGAGFTLRAKLVAVLALSVSFGITVGFVLTRWPARLAMIALAIGVASYVVSRPTKARE